MSLHYLEIVWFDVCGMLAVRLDWFIDWMLLSGGRSTSAVRHDEAKLDSKSQRSSSHKDHRDELSSSSGSLSKQVLVSYLCDPFASPAVPSTRQHLRLSGG